MYGFVTVCLSWLVSVGLREQVSAGLHGPVWVCMG